MANIPQFLKTFIASIKTVATTGAYSDLTGRPTLGTAAALDVGTTANKVMQVDDDGKIPALDGSNILNLPTSLEYIGDYKISAQSSDHGKWLLCRGAAVSRTTYSSLFAIIGTSFGAGDGSTTFNLPDARSSVLGSIGQRSGLTNRSLGSFVGAETHTLTISETPAHFHIDGFAGVNSAASYGVSTVAVAGNINMQSGGATINHANTSTVGGGTSHNNMQPTLFAGNTFIYAGV
jgi:microcystin-dependent protein